MSTNNFESMNINTKDEDKRLHALYTYRILDTPRESRFDDLTATIADLLNVKYAKLGFFDADRVWYKSIFGFNTTEGAIAGTMARLILENPQEILVIPNLQTDPRITSSSALKEDPNIKASCCVPIVTPDSFLIGMLCVFDTVERDFNPDERAALIRAARQIVELLESRREADVLQETLRVQQDELRIKSTSDRISRTLVNSVNTKKDLHLVLEKFNQSVINEFGWWGAQSWYEQDGELLPSDWVLSTSAPASLNALSKASAQPISLPTYEEVGLDRYEASEALLMNTESLEWHPMVKKLEAAGARDFVVINVTGPTHLALRLVFILPTSRSFIGNPKRVLEALRGLLPQVIRRARSSEELAYRATHDSLTGLLNRRGLEEMFPQSLSQLHVNTIRTVFFFDLDKFKQINDEFGHAVGDEYLIEVSKRLLESSRPVDSIARIGGDEFVIVAQGFDSHDAVDAAASRFLENLSAPFVSAERIHIKPQVSIGISQWRSHELLNTAISHADARMYDAKAKGGHQAVIDFSTVPNKSEPQNTLVPEIHGLTIHEVVNLKENKSVGFFVSLAPPMYHAPRVMQDLAHHIQHLMKKTLNLNPAESLVIIEIPGFRRSDRANFEALVDALYSLYGFTEISFCFDSRSGNLDSSNFARELAARGAMNVVLGNFGSGNNEIGLIQDLTPSHLLISQKILIEENTRNQVTLALLIGISKSVDIPLVLFEKTHSQFVSVLSDACTCLIIKDEDLGRDSE